MSDQIVADEHPVKAGKLDEYIKVLMKDTNFHLLPLPESIRERFNIPLEVKEMGIKEAAAKAFDSKHEYTAHEVRDQIGSDIVFPPLPPSEPPTVSICSTPLELEDHSSPHPCQSDASDSDHESTQQSASPQESCEEVK